LTFHNDVKPGERFFWYTTTGWMMWNFLQSSLLCGATAVLYDGSPGYPDLDVLWKLAQQTGGQTRFAPTPPDLL
jgi:acetoacetyl-CoA synthetase